MKKVNSLTIIVLVIHLLSSLFVNGQNISFSSKIKGDNNTDIADIAKIWKDYSNACLVDYVNQKDSVSLSFWNNEERELGHYDLIKYSLSRSFPLYIAGDLFVYDIKPISDDFYVIKNILSFSDSTGKTISEIFNVCARKEEKGFKLYNYFNLSSRKLNVYKRYNISFYYSCNFKFDDKVADKTANFYQEKLKQFGFEERPIIYIVGENVDEAKSYLGFDYSISSSSLKSAGLFIYPNIILSGAIDHYHELIHAIFIPEFPKANSLLQEGIATYFGGASGKSYKEHLKELSKFVIANPDTDLSQFEKLDNLIDNSTNYFYTIGAIIIDYAYGLGGNKKVISLFEHTDLYEAIKIELAIEKCQINEFLRDFVANNGSDD
ncbi:MAG TPA: hypothetical protein PKW37_07475 [Salinivirgaceae bacterium]|nr:hypothetical protein [Salinivirgaceae bacterium]